MKQLFGAKHLGVILDETILGESGTLDFIDIINLIDIINWKFKFLHLGNWNSFKLLNEVQRSLHSNAIYQLHFCNYCSVWYVNSKTRKEMQVTKNKWIYFYSNLTKNLNTFELFPRTL